VHIAGYSLAIMGAHPDVLSRSEPPKGAGL